MITMEMQTKIKIINPSLNYYYFAPKKCFQDDWASDETRNFFNKVWNVCVELGIKERNSDLELPVKFPKFDSTQIGFCPLAAGLDAFTTEKNRPRRNMFIFLHAEYVGLVITVEDDLKTDDLSVWNALNNKIKLPKPSPNNREIDCYLLFTGFLLDDKDLLNLSQAADRAPEQVIKNTSFWEFFKVLPPTLDNDLQESYRFSPDILPEGWLLWHKEVEKNESSFLILPGGTAEEVEADFFAWSTWYSKAEIAPFTGYLLHLSKFNYTSRLFWQTREGIKKDSSATNEILHYLISLNENIIKYQINITSDEFFKIENELLFAQAGSYRLKYALSRLQDQLRTLEIAGYNMDTFISRENFSSSQPKDAFFYRIDAKLKHLNKQINIEIDYLKTAQERIYEGHNLTRLIQEREARKISSRLNKLVLWQGSLLGALGITLAALQSFVLRLPLTESVLFSLAFFLGTLALSLPSLIIHWEEGYKTLHQAMGGLLLGSFSLLTATILNSYFSLFTVPVWLLTLSYVLIFFIGFLCGWLATHYVLLFRFRYLKSAHNIPTEGKHLLQWARNIIEKGNSDMLSLELFIKLQHSTNEYAKNNTILKKHELLNAAHEWQLTKKG